MAAASDLEKIAKLADMAETIIDLVKEYGFAVSPRPRGAKRGRPPTVTNGESPMPKRKRGRPRKIVVKDVSIPPAPTDDLGLQADELEDEE